MKKAYGTDKAEKHYSTVEAVTETLVSGQLYLRPSSQNSRFTQLPYKIFFLHSRKRPAPGTNTFFAAQGCPLKRSSTVLLKRIHLQTDQEVTELQFTQITEMTSILRINQTHMFTVNSSHEQILPWARFEHSTQLFTDIFNLS